MFTPRDIRDTEFERVSRGYKVEDVDGFLARLADQMEQLIAEKADSEQKLVLLAERVEQYRQEEDALRSALISAERMKEKILAEATQQQEILVRDAQQKADKIVADSEAKIEREETTLSALKQQVASFKSEVLNIYKSHLEILSDLPDEPEDMHFEDVMGDAAPMPFEQPVAAAEPVMEAAPVAPPIMMPEMFETPIMPEISEPVIEPVAQDSYDGFAPRAEETIPQPVAEQQPIMPEPPVMAEAPAEAPPAAQDSVFASFAVEAPAEAASPGEDASRFGKLDFGENFSFGRD